VRRCLAVPRRSGDEPVQTCALADQGSLLLSRFEHGIDVRGRSRITTRPPTIVVSTSWPLAL
jgi:hypothetical protein